MARFVVDIEKSFGGEYFTNVYHCNVADRGLAEGFALDVAQREAAITRANVAFIKARVRPDSGPGAAGSIVGLGFNGGLTAGSNNLPLFNVVRVDFTTAEGRPSRKYLRLPLLENEPAGNGGIVATRRTQIVTAYAQPMLNDGRFCDPQSQPFTGAIVMAAIGMRQLRRGAKAKQPVIP